MNRSAASSASSSREPKWPAGHVARKPRTRASKRRLVSAAAPDRSPGPATAEPAVSFPAPNTLRLSSRALFSASHGALAKGFFSRAFGVAGVVQVAIEPATRTGEIVFDSALQPGDRRVAALARAFAGEWTPAQGTPSGAADTLAVPEPLAVKQDKALRLQRYGRQLSTWTVLHAIPGRLRLHNPALHRRRELCQAIEREFMNTFGIDRYSTHELTATVLVQYNPKQIQRHQIVEILDALLAKASAYPISPIELDLPICTASVLLALTSQFLLPPLAPLSAGLFLYSVIPSFKSAYQVVVHEKRLGVDVLDAMVVIMCLATRRVLAGTVLGFTLGVARKLVQRTEDHSKKMLLNAFGKQPRFAWMEVNGSEVEVPLERLKVNDIIIVHTGETVPVDGEVIEGMAMVDQHTLTGESAPVEKIKGDKLLASTTLIGGKYADAVPRRRRTTGTAPSHRSSCRAATATWPS